MKNDECEGPTDAAIERSVTPDMWRQLTKQSRSLAAAFAPPLPGELALRVWYHQDMGRSKFCPKQSAYLGPRAGGTKHKGVDLYSRELTQLRAAATGTLQYNVISDPYGWGNHAYLYFSKDADRYICVYAHLHADSAFSGTKSVTAGDKIPIYSGCTGNAGGGVCDRTHRCKIGQEEVTPIEDHVHIELLKIKSDGSIEKRVDPATFFGWAVTYANDQRCDVCLEKTQTH